MAAAACSSASATATAAASGGWRSKPSCSSRTSCSRSRDMKGDTSANNFARLGMSNAAAAPAGGCHRQSALLQLQHHLLNT